MRQHGTVLANYFYDEDEKPLLKIYSDNKKEFYFGDSILKDEELLEPLKLGSRVLGYFKNGTFIKTGQDHLNSVLVNETKNVILNSPYGKYPVLGTKSILIIN